MNFEKEQELLFDNFLKRAFLSKNKALELIISPICNTKCTYCYYNNYSQYTYPAELAQKDKILENCKKLFTWAKENDYYPEEIDIFSGEFFNLSYYKEILELILLETRSWNKKVFLTIPTNATFCFSEEKTQEVQEFLDSCNLYNIQPHISISVDGKYLDNITRPLKNGKQYNDEYYDRLFKFAAKNKFGFHPMISSQGIKYWKENLDWYAESIQKYFNISEIETYSYLFLLEVRNSDWSKENLEDLESFLKYLYFKTFSLFNDAKSFYDNFFLKRATNIIKSPFSYTPRGLPCSFQDTLAIRLGDLALVPCHRTAYSGYSAGYLKQDSCNKFYIELENPIFWMFSNVYEKTYGPKCSSCKINELCTGCCLGCNFEVNKDFFIPVDTVCDLELRKVLVLVYCFKKSGILPFILKDLCIQDKRRERTKVYQFEMLSSFIENNENLYKRLEEL